ncbi:MAG: CBS domain-containing protein [Gammaproteobacteria bacterium]|nr:CBS domain-containing protein [Gammaproteobacteria bacterium]
MTDKSGKPPSPSWTDRFSQFLHVDPKNHGELITILKEATENAVINEDSMSMIEGVIQLSDMQARDIMVPRSHMVVVEMGTDLKGILKIVTESAHSRFPVIGEDRDDVIGMLLAKDLLNYSSQDSSGSDKEDLLMKNLRQAVVVPESKRLDVLLKDFRINRNHMAIVVDEYGGVSGLVTIEDVLEEIVGEIEDETDIDDGIEMIVEVEKGKWLIQAQIEIEDFNDYFSVLYEDDEYETLGGLLLQEFGHLPEESEQVIIDNFTFEIVQADNRRIISVHMMLLTPESENQDDTAAV